MDDLFEKISKLLFKRFVVNPAVVAIQHEDGRYATLKTSITPDMIRMMLIGGYSLGTYQQQTYNNKLKWICFDFDLKKKTNNYDDLIELKEKYIIPFTKSLKDKNISFITEFSGRRGFHIWIFFNQIISKNLAYAITNYLCQDICDEINIDSKFNIDLFPKTKGGKIPNKYGLQVKLPLSKHRSSGTYSYLIKDIEKFNFRKIHELDELFLKTQCDIIENIEENDVTTLLSNCNISVNTNEEFLDYHKQFINVNSNIKLADIKNVFCNEKALSLIWDSISLGALNSFERILLVGIFSHMNCGEEILDEIFKMQNNYNKIITHEMIRKYKNFIFPVTFKYLYQYYHLQNCPEKIEKIYIDDYIFDYLGISVDKYELVSKDERNINFIKDIVNKEINYFYYNDEVYNLDVLNEMKFFTYYDFSNIQDYINDVEKGIKNIPNNIEFYTYVRKEKDKERVLITLGAKERIITTALVNKLIRYSQEDYKSYSYHLNLGVDGDVFYPWITSWNKYKNDVSQYFNIPFFEDYVFLKIDFKNYYNNIYLQSAFEQFNNIEKFTHKNEFINIYRYLLNFNEKIMMEINNNIQGVPQGPAYARVLVELTMDRLLNQFFSQNDEFCKLKLYRYVDDIFVFGMDKIEICDFLTKFCEFFERKNLFLNRQKTKIYGKIKELLPQDRLEFAEFKDFNYDIFQLNNCGVEDIFEQEQFETDYLKFIYRKKEWDINDTNLIFSDKIDNSVKEKFYQQFNDQIIISELGRGSLFRKFYDYVFADSIKAKNFFENRMFNIVPEGSINQANLICSLIINFTRISGYIDNNTQKLLEDLCKKNTDKNKSILLNLFKSKNEGFSDDC